MGLMEINNPWGFEAPVATVVRDYDVSDFLTNAPVGTVIEVAGDLYKRAAHDEWLELENTVVGGTGYDGPYAEHETTYGSTLARYVGSVNCEVRVLRLGENF